MLRLVLGSGMKLAIIGVAIGIGGALALSSYIETMLFDGTPEPAAGGVLVPDPARPGHGLAFRDRAAEPFRVG